MEARELLEAAEIVAMSGAWNTKAWHAAKLLADHVLATVRPDDDEEATYEWAASLVDPKDLGRTYYGGKWQPCLWAGDRGWCRLDCGSTRRQFRALCEALGIETKEVRT